MNEMSVWLELNSPCRPKDRVADYRCWAHNHTSEFWECKFKKKPISFLAYCFMVLEDRATNIFEQMTGSFKLIMTFLNLHYHRLYIN
jgi:hypothetical protein